MHKFAHFAGIGWSIPHDWSIAERKPVSKCRKWSVWREALGLEKFAENHDIYKKKGLLEIKEIRREAYKADNKWFIDYLEIQASKKRN